MKARLNALLGRCPLGIFTIAGFIAVIGTLIIGMLAMGAW